MSTSLFAASSRAIACPSGTAMLSASDFLPRFAELKYAESFVSLPSPSRSHGGPKARESSPTPGRSTLMTSAPRSARFWLAQGPASTRERSRTRMCERGPATGLPYERKGRSLALMIRHIVLWRLKSTDEATLRTIRQALEAQAGRILGLSRIEVGHSFNTGRRAVDLALTCD